MKRVLTTLLIALLLLTGAAITQAAQETDTTPTIDQFETSATSVSRADLIANTARIAVAWAVLDRPLTANLVFEQQMPGSGTFVNIELPRPWEWVNSVGTGIVAPVVPDDDDATNIRLRLAVVDRESREVLAQRFFEVPIVEGDGVSIESFSTSASGVTRQQLTGSTARIPVSWSVANRTLWMNLAFEQFLPGSRTWRNVELPRPWDWVSSSGTGVVAPILPDDGRSQVIQLRLKVFDRFTGAELTTQQIDLPITSTATATIDVFTTSVTSVDADALADDSARVPVTWSVSNRPANSNLVFEQILPDGSLYNVELPRPDPYVASSGTGLTQPTSTGTEDEIVLQVRLIDLSTRQTITSRTLTLPVVEDADPEVIRFDAQPRPAETGDTLTVTWEVANTSTIEISVWHTRMQPASIPLREFAGQATTSSLPLTGSIQVTVPENITQMRFTLRYGGPSAEEIIVPINITCAIEWFADRGQAQCPDAPPAEVQAAYQPFENGFMVWHQNQIWAFLDNGRALYLADTWNGQPFDQPNPPAGFVAPINGFGWAWNNSAELRGALGWGTAPEQGYTMRIQSHAVTTGSFTGRDYTFSLPDGDVMTATVGQGRITDFTTPR
ncbi:MAG: hypothetical protein ACOCYT_00575 [Chloroflexota bacterium]